MGKTYLLIDKYKNTIEIPVKVYDDFLRWVSRSEFDEFRKTLSSHKTIKELDGVVRAFLKDGD